jgi:hypothetical protein
MSVDVAMVHALLRGKHASALAGIETMAQTSPECGCRSLDIITIGGVVPSPATSVFALKTLLTRSCAEEAATTQLVAHQ